MIGVRLGARWAWEFLCLWGVAAGKGLPSAAGGDDPGSVAGAVGAACAQPSTKVIDRPATT